MNRDRFLLTCSDKARRGRTRRALCAVPVGLALLAAGWTIDTLACGPEIAWPLLAEAEPVTSLVDRPFQNGLALLELPAAEVERRESGDPAQALLDVELDALRRHGKADPQLERRLIALRAAIRDHRQRLDEWRQWGSWSEERPVFPGPGSPHVQVPDQLPDELRLYLEGAVAYHRSDPAAAAASWRRLLELPADERRERTVMAHLMLGRVDDDPHRAIEHLREVRRLAEAGWRDDLGLAFESLGWQARRELDRGRFAEALRLYARQLAGGDPSAAVSLEWTCAALLRSGNVAALAAVAGDELTRRLYTHYLTAHDHQIEASERWLGALEMWQLEPDLPSAFAWLAYQRGRFELAARWLEHTDGDDPFTPWLAAKLAARDGDLDGARAHLDEAAARLARHPDLVIERSGEESYWQWAAATRARAEAGALELGRDRYRHSLEDLLESGYWMDAAYLAERVLEVDELRAHVDERWPAGRGADEIAADTQWSWHLDDEPVASPLRYLLARRLAREGRWAEAASYYPERSLRDAARAMAEGAALIESRGPAKERASELWRRAQVLRELGLELVGTELAPDWHLWGGQLTIGEFPRQDPDAEEQGRVRAARPVPDERFHYRYAAADLAWRAAELMPDGSTATAEVLHTAGSWLKTLDPQRAERFYKALVRRCGQTPLGREADRRRWFVPDA